MTIDETATSIKIPETVVASKSFAVSTWLFMRCLGLAYLFAFGSLAFQVLGLMGHDGILPADRLMEYLHTYRSSNVWYFPTLLWVNSSDTALLGLCWGGVFFSVLVAIGVLTAPCLFLCWLFWLSLLTVGQDFLSFQWDILLLETGFISIFVANSRLVDWPWKKNDGFDATHPFSVLIFRWLLFRLMLESGICKLASGDNTWRSLTAMQYHFHTQPLPTPLAWFADKFPPWLQSINVLFTFLFELVFPFLMFLGRTGRLLAAAGFVALQVVIALTGNYAYFNFLTIALCLFLIDDEVWRKAFEKLWRRFGARLTEATDQMQSEKAPGENQNSGLPDSAHENSGVRSSKKIKFQFLPPKAISAPAKTIAMVSAVAIWLLSLADFTSNSGQLPPVVDECLTKIARYRLVNSYGLFATMTTTRTEIQIEGSTDGNLWIPYDFRFKPEELNAPPCIVAPAQPRLDWQMWFAALGSVEQSPWFAHLLLRLFQNSPEVLHLLKHNPFPDKPPTYLRAKLYLYTFSDWNALIKSGEWWHKEYVGDYCPAISAQQIHETQSAE